MAEPDNIYEQYWADLESEYPVDNFAQYTQLPGEEWLPKTDWSRDGIIANED